MSAIATFRPKPERLQLAQPRHSQGWSLGTVLGHEHRACFVCRTDSRQDYCIGPLVYLSPAFHKRDDGGNDSALPAYEAMVGLVATGIPLAGAAIDPDETGAT
jgi:hypothetical protein